MKRRPRTIRQRTRAALLWLHRWMGIFSGIIVFIVAITGCIYVFEKEAREWFQYPFYHVAKTGTTRLDIDQLSNTVKQRFPSDVLASIRVVEDPGATVLFTTKKGILVSVDPYTGAINGVKNNKDDFFNVVLDLHRTLWMGETGKSIIKWNVVIFFLLCVTGLVLWWPKHWRVWKRALTIRGRKSNIKRFTWDLHSVLGFYALIILLIISLTGLFFAFDGVKDTVRLLTGPPAFKREGKVKNGPMAKRPLPVQQAYQFATTNHPGAEETLIALPADSMAAIRISLQYPYAITRKQDVIYFDQRSGQLIKENLARNYKMYDVIARSNYQLHTGNIPHTYGIIKVVYFLASLVAASLPVTGFLIWYKRKRKKRKKYSLMPTGVSEFEESEWVK